MRTGTGSNKMGQNLICPEEDDNTNEPELEKHLATRVLDSSSLDLSWRLDVDLASAVASLRCTTYLYIPFFLHISTNTGGKMSGDVCNKSLRVIILG